MRIFALVLVAFFCVVAAASAHVTVIPSSARPGETKTLAFRVLNEKSDATTVEVDLFIPAGLTAHAADRPAPVLQLTASGRPQSSGGSSSATGWAILALLAALALGGAALIVRRRRRRP